MSRPRSRPTREETRDRLLHAAARVFSDKGIGSASIEEICDEAGFSRGAFYSNFTAKDELIIALLDANVDDTRSEMDRLFDESTNPTDFIDNMQSDQRRNAGPLDFEGSDLLEVELILYARRNPDNRAALVDYQRRKQHSNEQILERIVAAVGRDYPIPLDELASLVIAIDVGVGLNRLIDPESNPSNQFSEFMSLIHRMWLATPDGALD